MMARAASAMFAGRRPFRTGSSATNQRRYGRAKNPSRAPPTWSRSQAPGASRRSRTSRGCAARRRSSPARSPASMAETAWRKRSSSFSESCMQGVPFRHRQHLPERRSQRAARVGRRRARAPGDEAVEPDLAPDLPGAHADPDGARVRRRAGVALDDQHLHVLAREEESGEEPDGAAADHQDRGRGFHDHKVSREQPNASRNPPISGRSLPSRRDRISSGPVFIMRPGCCIPDEGERSSMDVDLLLAATYRGDLRAFEALVRSQAGPLRRIASRITADESLADDVVQETFLRVLRVPEAARPSRAAAAWLSRVTVRVALNLLESERARRRREERYATERSELMKDGASHGPVLPADLERPVAGALASLSPETRAALWLHVVEGEGVREVAACLGSSRSAVSRRIRAGLDELRSSLAKSGTALVGAAALRGALRGSEVSPAESLVRRIVEAGRLALASGAARPTASGARDALDAALAEPVRSLRPVAVIGSAAVLATACIATLVWLVDFRPTD